MVPKSRKARIVASILFALFYVGLNWTVRWLWRGDVDNDWWLTLALNGCFFAAIWYFIFGLIAKEKRERKSR